MKKPRSIDLLPAKYQRQFELYLDPLDALYSGDLDSSTWPRWRREFLSLRPEDLTDLLWYAAYIEEEIEGDEAAERFLTWALYELLEGRTVN